MSKVWVITGASSIISREFTRLIANNCHELILVARNSDDIALTASDLKARFEIQVKTIQADFTNHNDVSRVLNELKTIKDSLSLFLAHSLTTENNTLNQTNIDALIDCNIKATSKLIHCFANECKKPQHLVYLSSVAGDRGREKNSLYGASKKMIDIYIDGLRGSHPHIHFFKPRLGFIDTKETYGKPGIFYALPVPKLAKRLVKAINRKQINGYIPFFWRYIMWIIKLIPNKIFYKLKI